MGIATLIITLQSILVVLGLAIFGQDLFFIKTNDGHLNVVFTWRFYVQTGIIGVLVIYFTIALIMFVIERRRLRHGSVSPYQSRNTVYRFIPLIQTIIVAGLSAGLLYATVPALIGKNRTVFFLPFNRDSAQDQSINHDYTMYDPKNLYQCPESDSNPLTRICSFDRTAITGGAAFGVIAIIEALSMLVYRSSTASGSQSYWRNDDSSELGHLHPVPLESYPAHKSGEI
ncbi:hypothetical protein BGX27_002998 [Mortierella sp. AM989]|nr:hypothetical protein BGX27_002998 [Mortierella sp. AM989]